MFTKNRKTLHSKSKNIQKKNKFFLIQFWSGKKCTFENRVKKYNQKFHILRLKAWNYSNCWFSYLRTGSSSNGHLVTLNAIFTTMPNSFLWKQERLGSISKYIYATKYIFKKSSSKCSSYYVGGISCEHAELFLRIKFLWTKIRKQNWNFFLEKKFILGIFLHNRAMQVWQRWQKNGQKLKSFPLKFSKKLYQ